MVMKISMVLQKEIFFMKIYLVCMIVFVFSHISHGEKSNRTIKNMIVHEILKKVSNITMNTLSKAPAEKKENVLHRIEHKLKQSAKAMGTDANKYVKFIMEEFKSKANENINKQPVVSQRKSSRVVNEKPKVRSSVATDTKQEIIQEIADKIQSLAKGFMKNAKTIEKKKEVLQKIKKRIEESAKQKHMQIHSKHEELKEYSSLIAQGLEVSMRKMLDEEKAMNARRMQSDADNVPTIKNNITFEPVIENVDIEVKNRASHVIHDPHIDKTSKFLFDLTEINKYKQLIEESLNDTSIDPLCDEIVEETCLNIQSFNKISCGDGKTVPIEYLCNGEIDCRNHSDEENCTTQAIEKVRKATTVMADIEASFNRQCFASTSDGTILTAQNQILRDVLETQINFLQQHDQASPAETEKDKDHVDITFIKKTVGDVNMILSTLSYALDGTLCAQHIDPFRTGNSAARKYNDIEVDELDDGPEDPSWSPKSCTCKRQYCEDEKCAAACKRVCWQKYSLNHWTCQAINGATSVSLDAICDGKLDCFDETDESNCAMIDSKRSKFDVSSTFSNLLDLLTTKAKSYEFMSSRNKLAELHALIRQLQKQTMRTNIDVHSIKILRDEAFDVLVSIYEDLSQSLRLQQLDDAYLHLLSINENLVSALKGTHTGNENLISPASCYCRDGLCALRRCNRNCVQACLAEPVLTRFDCNERNATTTIENICNGKNNCPNGEDEKNCKKDVCRAHHLVVLRHNLQNVGLKHKGTVLGEVIETWRAKVSASLYIAEKPERPNHNAMTVIINRVLHDLVMAFAAMEDYRRTNSDYALKEFISISKIVMDTIKSCSN